MHWFILKFSLIPFFVHFAPSHAGLQNYHELKTPYQSPFSIALEKRKHPPISIQIETPKKQRNFVIDKNEKEPCWWLECLPGNSSTKQCPAHSEAREIQNCGVGRFSFECCEKVPKPILDDRKMSYEDYVKFLFLRQADYKLQPDQLRCDMLDPEKKHFVRVRKNIGIRTCDMCPYLPQKYLANVYLDREAKATKTRVNFDECFGLCYEDKTCMVISFNQANSTCYIFNSTAGGYQTGKAWITVLMTQPSGVARDWSYTRHTRLMGQQMDYSEQLSFLHCLESCDQTEGCNYVSYSTANSTCSYFANDTDVKNVDLVYGYLSGIRISEKTSELTLDQRFIQEGNVLSVAKTEIWNECKHISNATHGAYRPHEWKYSGPIETFGCNADTGCKTCYYPEKTKELLRLSICPDSKIERLRELKALIHTRMKACLDDKNCVGVGYNSNTDETMTIDIRDFVRKQYTTRYTLKFPPDDARKYLQLNDLIARTDIKPISGTTGDYEEHKDRTFQQCIEMFEMNLFTRLSYSLKSKVCKFGTEKTAFIATGKEEFFTMFKRPPLLSPALNYIRTPGYRISGQPRVTTENCVRDCEDKCSNQCSKKHGDWCVYISLQQRSNGARCQFYDDDTEFTFKVEETSVIMTRVSALDFSLKSFDKLNTFQSSDTYNCFLQQNRLTRTSLTDPIDRPIKVSHSHKQINVLNIFKNLGKNIVKSFRNVGDPNYNFTKTIKNVVRARFDSVGQEFMQVPFIDLTNNTGVVTADWNKVKNKRNEIPESDAFALITNIRVIEVEGNLVYSGFRVGTKILGKKTFVSTLGKKDEAYQHGRRMRNYRKDDNENIDKPRGEACQAANPGNCNQNPNQAKCVKPKRINYAIGETLTDCDDRKLGDKCYYECQPGYQEQHTTAVCVSSGSKAEWQPRPHCIREECLTGNDPLIVVRTPRPAAFGGLYLRDYIPAYVVLYDKRRKLPMWSIALHQTGQFESKQHNAVKQDHGFAPYPCKQIKNHQANDDDYKGHGKDWHKGHLTPANVARWSQKAKRVSNLYINAAPQDAYSDSKPWSILEKHVDCFSKRYQTVVATGICKDSLPQKLGSIPIPTCFWKMACYRDEENNHQVVGFYSSNTLAKTKKEQEERTKEILTPLSQDELLRKVSGGFNDVWLRPTHNLSTGRPVHVDSSVWFPVNLLSCHNQRQLSSDEKNGWREAFKGVRSQFPRGKNTKESDADFDDEDFGGGSYINRKRRNQVPKLNRGCLVTKGTNMRNALDESKPFLPHLEEEGVYDHDEGDGLVKVSVQKCGKRIVGYYTSWGEKTIAGLELQRLTHVIYAYLEMDSNGRLSLGPAEIAKKSGKRLKNLMGIARQYPHLNVMFSVGGWENSQYFSDVAASPKMRLTFIASVIRMIDEWRFDGVDIDWEYPVSGGVDDGVPADKQNYVILMKELRTALDTLAHRVEREEKYLISFAGATGKWAIDAGYDLLGLFKYVDFVNLMTYDLFGPRANMECTCTGPPSALYSGLFGKFSGKTNVDFTVKYYTCKTHQPHKINMGVPFFGRYWKNVGDIIVAEDKMIRAISSVNGKRVGGYVPWYKIKTDYLNDTNFEKEFHGQSKTPYALNNKLKIFLGYEDGKSLEHKTEYAVDKNVGGLTVWALDFDDDDLTLLNVIAKSPLCQKTNPKDVNYKCSPIDDKRWWNDHWNTTFRCGRNERHVPLYKGFYPVCDPDDPAYSCCSDGGWCGGTAIYCDCPKCINYGKNPQKILDEPIKP